MLTSKIIDSFYTRVKNVLDDKKNANSFIQIVSNYVDRNSENLSATGPTKQIIFSDMDRDNVFKLFNLDPHSISTIAKTVPDIARSVNANNPFNLLLVMIIRYFRITKNDNGRKAAYIYLILSMYPSIFTKYFKYEPNEQIMMYTISNLSNKYKFKQNGTLIGTLTETATVADEHFAKDIIRGNDKDLADYIMSVKTRLNALIKNICAEFMKQHKAGNYLNYEEDNTDEENFKVSDNNSFIIKRVSDAVTLKLHINGPDSRIVQVSAKMCEVSLNDLRNTVDKMCKDKTNSAQIKEVISAILYDFLFEGKHTQEAINSSEFIVYSLETYKKSNTINTNIVKIKEVLDAWLRQYSVRYTKTNRVSTLNNFRKALYMFFIFTIQKTKA